MPAALDPSSQQRIHRPRRRQELADVRIPPTCSRLARRVTLHVPHPFDDHHSQRERSCFWPAASRAIPTAGETGLISIPCFAAGTDGGKTWEPARVLRLTMGKTSIENATFIADGDRVYLMLITSIPPRAYLKTKATMEGATWRASREKSRRSLRRIERATRFDTGKFWRWAPGHGIVLKSSRFVVPIWLSTDHSHRPSITSTIYSDDKGVTWQAGDVVTQNLPESKNPSENVCTELADGRVIDNIRCESTTHRRLVAYGTRTARSTRGSQPALDENLFEPVCFASMTTIFPVAAGLEESDSLLQSRLSDRRQGGEQSEHVCAQEYHGAHEL